MKLTKTILLITLLTSMNFVSANEKKDPVVLFETSAGNFEVTLNAEKAPITVKNFLALIDQKHYNGTIFHRVIKKFMIQGGGLNTSMNKIGGVTPITNEADNGLKNLKGTIAMARTGEPHSATDQFFINTKNNKSLDHSGKNMRGWGYAVFGKVTSGMDVVVKIESSDTDTRSGRRNVPVKTIEILSVTRVKTDSPVKGTNK